MEQFFEADDDLRTEIAMAAARLIAEYGYDYPSARTKAIKQMFGKSRFPRERTPSDQEIEQELRAYQALYLGDEQPAQLAALRKTAIAFMQAIEAFEPIAYGAVVNGTGSEHSIIHLLAFSDDPKEVDYWLMNQNIDMEGCDDAQLAGKSFPAVAFQWQREWFKLGTASPVDRRGLLNRNSSSPYPFQTDLAGLVRLQQESQTSDQSSTNHE